MSSKSGGTAFLLWIYIRFFYKISWGGMVFAYLYKSKADYSKEIFKRMQSREGGCGKEVEYEVDKRMM